MTPWKHTLIVEDFSVQHSTLVSIGNEICKFQAVIRTRCLKISVGIMDFLLLVEPNSKPVVMMWLLLFYN